MDSLNKKASSNAESPAKQDLTSAFQGVLSKSAQKRIKEKAKKGASAEDLDDEDPSSDGSRIEPQAQDNTVEMINSLFEEVQIRSSSHDKDMLEIKEELKDFKDFMKSYVCLLYTSPSPRD